jgi:RecA-family ATPase
VRPDINDVLRMGGEEAVRERLAGARPFPANGNVESGLAGQVAPPLRIINPVEWEGAPIPPREWIVPGFVPAGTVTLLYGDGAAGKSTLELQLGVARALDREWLSTRPRPGRTLILSAEDDADELLRRLDAIREHYGCAFADLGDLRLVDLVGESAVLGELARNGVIQATPLFDAICSQIEDFRPDLVGVDALADVYAGDENNRAQARQFIGLLKRPARKFGCAFLALAHPSLTGMNSGTGTSGNTGWSNSVRSRLYFEAAKASDGSEPDPDMRTLTVKKSNYARAGEVLTVKWQAGVYVAQTGASSLDKRALENRADATFLELVAAYEAEGRHVSPTPSATFAPKVFAGDPRANGIGKAAFANAMNRLFAAGKVVTATHGRPSDPRTHVAIAEAEAAE